MVCFSDCLVDYIRNPTTLTKVILSLKNRLTKRTKSICLIHPITSSRKTIRRRKVGRNLLTFPKKMILISQQNSKEKVNNKYFLDKLQKHILQISPETHYVNIIASYLAFPKLTNETKPSTTPFFIHFNSFPIFSYESLEFQEEMGTIGTEFKRKNCDKKRY